MLFPRVSRRLVPAVDGLEARKLLTVSLTQTGVAEIAAEPSANLVTVSYTDQTHTVIDINQNGSDTFYGADQVSSIDFEDGGQNAVDVVYNLTDIDETATGGDSVNVFFSRNGNNTFTGGDDVNIFMAGDGANTFTGGNGMNIFFAGNGDNSFTTGADSFSVVEAGSGNDTFDVGSGTSVVRY
jgi:Ca2+-binding RTX toxin-like protein